MVESQQKYRGFTYRLIEDAREVTRRLLKGWEVSELVEPAGSGRPSSPSTHAASLTVGRHGRFDTGGRV